MALVGGVVERFGTGAPKVTMASAAAITAGKLVEMTGDRTVQMAGAISQKVVGVAMQGCDAVADKIGVATGGVWNLVASGAISAGDLLVTDTAGRVKTMAAVDATNVGTLGTGATALRGLVGIALEAIADGASGPVKLRLGG